MRRHVRRARRHVPGVGTAPPFQLAPPGDSSAQVIANFTGASTGHLHTLHQVWLPDQVTYDGATWSYTDAASYPVIFCMPGQGATPSTMVTNTLPTFKTAIGNGQLPPCIIVYPNTTDPDDSIEGWAMNSENDTYPLEDMLRLDLTAYIEQHTRAKTGAANRVMTGFSKGGFETCRMRAKWGSAAFAAYVVAGAPRLDADLGGAGAAYSNYTQNGTLGAGAQQAKLFSSLVANCQSKSPISSSAGTGIFNVKGNNPDGLGAAPLLMLRSSPGDTTTQNSMNNAETQMTALSITRTAVNLDNASFTPTHNPSQYWAAWIAEAVNNLGWITTNAGWALP